MTVHPLPRGRALAATPPTSGTRQRLAEAITALRKHETTLTTTEGALEWGGSVQREITAATAAIEEAEQSIVEAKQRAADHFVDPTASRASGPSVGDARAKLQAALDRLDIANAARTQLQARVQPLQSEVRWGRDKVDTCAREVIRETVAPHLPTLLADMARLHREVVERGHLLQWLTSSDIIADRGPAAPPDVVEMLCRLSLPPLSWAVAKVADASERAWAATFEALKSDPLASLPDIASK